jgi:hypothetical protein
MRWEQGFTFHDAYQSKKTAHLIRRVKLKATNEVFSKSVQLAKISAAMSVGKVDYFRLPATCLRGRRAKRTTGFIAGH